MTSSGTKKVLVVALWLLVSHFAALWIHGAMATRIAGQLHVHAPTKFQHFFWDTEPYSAGITSFNEGRSPYSVKDVDNPLPFAYPPIFVWVGGALARILPAPWGWRLYITVYIVSVVLLEVLLVSIYMGRMRRPEIVALLCLAPLCFVMSTILWSGNIHILWYCAAWFAAIPGLTCGRWQWFYLVALLAIVNQPVFLSLLLLPIFAGTRQYMQSALTVAASGCVYVAEILISPGLYQQFRESIVSHLTVSRDFGQGVFGLSAYVCSRFHIFNTEIPGALQVLFSCALVATLFWLRPRVVQTDRRWWALITLGVVLVNPRIMPYDAALGLIPAIYFLIYGLSSPWQSMFVMPVVLGSLIAHNQVGFSLVLLSGFLVGVWQMSGRGREFYGPVGAGTGELATL